MGQGHRRVGGSSPSVDPSVPQQHESAQALPSGEEEREVCVSCAVSKL